MTNEQKNFSVSISEYVTGEIVSATSANKAVDIILSRLGIQKLDKSNKFSSDCSFGMTKVCKIPVTVYQVFEQ